MLGFLGACLLLLLGLMGVIPGSNLADSQWLQSGAGDRRFQRRRTMH